MDKPKHFSCIDCSLMGCTSKGDSYPSFCVSKKIDDATKEKVLACYAQPDTKTVMQTSAEVECDFYGQMTRLQETMEFAKRMGFTKIGIATCVGLLKESRILARILREHGFEVFGVGCKAGEIPKLDVGLPEKCLAVGKNICNPIMQAELLAQAGTEFNLVVGLCVGHDSLFYQHSKALTSTFATKDRVLGHNAMAVIYTADSYYAKKLKPEQP